jgi:HSP20 family protein
MRQEQERATADAGGTPAIDHIQVEMVGLLREAAPGVPVPTGQHWISTRQRKVWRPPTDVYETDTCIVVKVEIAGMQYDDFCISLEPGRLIISGVRHDPAAKLGYQQMEIPYGQFQTEVRLPRAIDEEGIEATYQDGFLNVVLPKAKARQVPVINSAD